MCGILCGISTPSNINGKNCLEPTCQILLPKICNRGPDSILHRKYFTSKYCMYFSASVLWLQGSRLYVQPVERHNSILAYNGDIYEGLGLNNIENVEDSDTKLLLDSLDDSNSPYETLSSLKGPFSLIYLNKKGDRLYFGRDRFGRKSLLIGKLGSSIILTSVAVRNTSYKFMELPAVGIFCIDFVEDKLFLEPWYKNTYMTEKVKELSFFLSMDIIVTDSTIFMHSGENSLEEPTKRELQILKNCMMFGHDKFFDSLLHSNTWFLNVIQLKNLLEEAVKVRVSKQPRYCRNCLKSLNVNCNHSNVGVLFSGGVDCAVLALMADKFVDKRKPIGLLNVAFGKSTNFETPDRVTGRQTLKELKKCCPDRNWNFIEINVNTQELDTLRRDSISDLIYPLSTVLDDSLGCALWFAARGSAEGYVSSSRVLLSGMGADELFGGYTRHRLALKRHSWKGLHNVMNEDWQNISCRNLGRDDRVVSDHGRQLRMPYIDENVVEFVLGLPCWMKSHPTEDIPQGIGEKVLLRSLAFYLGLKVASTNRKKALQFGTRIANSKENAHEVSQRLHV